MAEKTRPKTEEAEYWIFWNVHGDNRNNAYAIN